MAKGARVPATTLKVPTFCISGRIVCRKEFLPEYLDSIIAKHWFRVQVLGIFFKRNSGVSLPNGWL